MQKKMISILVSMLFFAVCFAQDNNVQDSIATASVQHSGVLSIQSSVPAGVSLNGQAVGNTPFSMELAPGWVIYSVRAPGYWTETFLAKVELGGKILTEAKLKKYELPVQEMSEVSRINNLRVLESLYDSLSREPVANSDSVCIAIFVADYPLPISTPDSLKDTSNEFRSYYEVYSYERELSFNEWYVSCSGSGQIMNGVSKRINELGATQIDGFIPVVGGKFEPADSSGLKGNMELYLLSTDGRADVIWKGAWANDFLTGGTLINALTASSPSALAFLTAQNQTVWVPIENGYSRHFYKYHELNISWNGLLIPMKGEFILPEWLVAYVLPPVEETVPEQAIVEPVVEQPAIEPPKAFLAKIPGGNLKYKGADMQIKPFAMNTNVISQDLYKSKCGKKDFGKYKGDSLPAHSVNWKEANSCCITLGGELPTEAQWEYAARAGSPLKYIWGNDANLKDYAEFNGKKPITVASKKPNGWGLYDMFGNVAEWVKDDGFWFGKYKYLKGGSWKSGEKDLSFENHEEEDARYWGTHTGFRCVFK
jgi:hypothetical protein